MDIGIVGGGINGLCTAWRLASRGHQVTLYERNGLMEATSVASSKLLHGGLRYLESGQFRLVRQALRERDAWLARAPDHARALPILLPVYRHDHRRQWMLGLGLRLYDGLAGRSALPKSTWLSPEATLALAPDLKPEGLAGAYRYYDGQMDDRALGLWVAGQSRALGVRIREQIEVRRITSDGQVELAAGGCIRHQRLCNIAGPWAEQLLVRSAIRPRRHLDLVRGSHLVLDRPCAHALILQIPVDRRVLFVLPWKGASLVGTTEVRQALDEPIRCSNQETRYLLDAYNAYLRTPADSRDVASAYAGLRPLVRSSVNPSHARRDYVMQRDGSVLSVFGGKWTTAPALADAVTRRLLH